LFSSCKIDQTDRKSSFDVKVRYVIVFREFGQVGSPLKRSVA